MTNAAPATRAPARKQAAATSPSARQPGPLVKRLPPRERLLKEAALIFAERGLQGVTIREVAQTANVQLSDIYRHFADKRALYMEVCGKIMGEKSRRYIATLEAKSDPARRILHFTAILYNDLLRDPCFTRLFIRELLERDESSIKELTEKYFIDQFRLACICLKAIGCPNAERTGYSIYLMTLGQVQMMDFGKAVPVHGLKWSDPVAMARFILGLIVPHVDWSKYRLRTGELGNS